jgi:glutathione S-transferase
LKATVRDNLGWLDKLLAGKQFVVGDRFTVADIILYCALEFGKSAGQPLEAANRNVAAWLARVGERPSAQASLHPQAAAAGMAG